MDVIFDIFAVVGAIVLIILGIGVALHLCTRKTERKLEEAIGGDCEDLSHGNAHHPFETFHEPESEPSGFYAPDGTFHAD